MIGLLSRTKSIWIGPALTVAAGVSYTLYIDDRNRLDTDTPLKFRPESVDDMISHATNSGDIVLFDRKMTSRHIVPTICTMFNKGMYKGDFDHCGIIIKDKYGSPYVYELTHNGAKMYPYTDRVLRSKARQIIVVPILSPFVLPEERREMLLQRFKHSCSNIGSLSYLTQFTLGILSCSIAGIFGPDLCSIPHSAECSFVLKALKEIAGDDFEKIDIPKSHTVTYKTLIDEVNNYSHMDKVLYIR